MGVVDPPRDPFFHHEALQVGWIIAQIDRRNLDRYRSFGVRVDAEIDVAPTAAVDFPDDAVAVEQHPRLQQRRQRQLQGLSEHVARFAVRQDIDAHDLNCDVVVAAPREGLIGDGLGRGVEIAGVAADGSGDEPVIDMFIGAVGHQQENVAGFGRHGLVVDFDLRIDAERAPQVGLFR